MILYEVNFVPMWPVGGHLFIYADDMEEASRIAVETVKHTEVTSIIEVPMIKGVMSYASGDY